MRAQGTLLSDGLYNQGLTVNFVFLIYLNRLSRYLRNTLSYARKLRVFRILKEERRETK